MSNSPVADVVYKNVEQQWDYAGIATQWKNKVKEKILKLEEEYRSVQKRRGKSSNVQKVKLFIESLDWYFFIAHQEAAHKMNNDF